MKVIFLKDLKKQGKKNEIKDVSDGYATNYLIKNGYAVKYTKSSSERLDTEITQNKINEENNIRIATEIKNKLEKEVISFNVSTGKDGKKVYVTEILASNISFLDSKGTGATGNTSFNNLPEPPMVDTSSNNMETVSVEKDPFEAFGDSIEISDNDLPF